MKRYRKYSTYLDCVVYCQQSNLCLSLELRTINSINSDAARTNATIDRQNILALECLGRKNYGIQNRGYKIVNHGVMKK